MFGTVAHVLAMAAGAVLVPLLDMLAPPPKRRPPRLRARPAPPQAPRPLLLPPPEPEPAATVPEPPAPAPAPRARRAPRPTASDGENLYGSGHFYFKASILDKLDDYRRFIKRMRKHDAEAYDLYTRIGAVILPSGNAFIPSDGALSRHFLDTLPGFGAVAMLGADVTERPDKDRISPVFQYFRKYDKTPPWVQPVAGGTVYLAGFYFDDRQAIRDGKRGGVCAIPLQVMPDGSVHALRQLQVRKQRIRHRRHIPGESRVTILNYSSWGLPETLLDWARDNGREDEPERFLSDAFSMLVGSFEASATTMIRVAASKGGITAAFSVDPLRTPHFFDDRDVYLTASGRKRPIFHVVRPHVRTLADGRTLPIRMHFQGLRRFTWNSHDVLITVPGKHHADLAAMPIGATEVEDGEPAHGKLDPGQFGEYLRGHIERGAASPASAR